VVKNPLGKTNPYLRIAGQRKALLFRSVSTSSAIEGVRLAGKALYPKKPAKRNKSIRQIMRHFELHLLCNCRQSKMSKNTGGTMHICQLKKLPPPKRKQIVQILDAFLESERVQ